MIEKAHLNEDSNLRGELLDIFTDRNITITNMLSGIDTLNIIVDSREFDEYADDILDEIQSRIDPTKLSVNNGLAIIAIVGRELGTSPAIAVKVLGALANHKINIRLIDHGSEKINMLIGVGDEDYLPAVQAIYKEFTSM